MLAEAWREVFFDPVHWWFELTLMVLFDGVLLGLAWPFIRKHWKHDREHHRSLEWDPPDPMESEWEE